MKVLLIGSLPPPLGGTTLTLDALRAQLHSMPGVELSVIDTGRIRGRGLRALFMLAALAWQLLKKIPQADVVSLHVATTALSTVGFFTALTCRLFRTPLVLRKFASADYAAGSVVRRLCAHCAIELASVFLVETKTLVARSRQRGYLHTFWFPTHRDRPIVVAHAPSGQASRFVFVGQIREYKGVHELLAAARALETSGICIDFFGPLYAPFAIESFSGSNVRYGGVLAPQQVMTTLADYDVLILPTKAQSEGYPGVIVEALQMGLPVITTRCGAIEELVDESCALLVSPGDSEGLRDAIATLHQDAALYCRLRAAVATRAEGLSTRYWAAQFVRICAALAAGTVPDDASLQATTPAIGDCGSC